MPQRFKCDICDKEVVYLQKHIELILLILLINDMNENKKNQCYLKLNRTKIKLV